MKYIENSVYIKSDIKSYLQFFNRKTTWQKYTQLKKCKNYLVP